MTKTLSEIVKWQGMGSGVFCEQTVYPPVNLKCISL